MALLLHAVTPTDSPSGPLVVPEGTTKIVFRDLASVVSVREKFALDDAEEGLGAHRAVVDGIFRRQVVLPTPPGVVFRTEHVLTRWMELHYVALNDALAFVTDRLAVRVHVERAGGIHKEDVDAGSDLAEVAGTVFRDLRRRAVASVPLTIEQVTGITLSGAFLVERELFREFERGVAEVKASQPKLSINLTGPWAPYDFVRMQFGD